MKFISPLKILKSKVREFILNLNQYRNTHYRVLNTCKINYKEHMKKQIKKAKRFNKAIFVYKVFASSNRKYDLGNVCSVHEKFFEDAFVELKRIEDDNATYIPIVLYLKGNVDKENPRVEIDVFEYNKEGVDKLVEMIYNVYKEDNGCVD